MNLKITGITNFIFLVILSVNAYSQFTYLGLSTQKLSHYNSHMQVKQDTVYIPTQNGLFKKAVASIDTTWIPGGFQGMIINDFILIGADTIICVVDSTEGNTIFISTNNGNTFFNSTNGFGGTGPDFIPGGRIDVNPANHLEIIATSGACIAKSADFCASWNPVYLDWGSINYQSTVLRYHPLNSGYIYSGGELSLFDSFLTYSFDGGSSWLTSSGESNNAVNDIAFHPDNVDTIFLGKEGKIVRSVDKGVTWSDVFLTPDYEYIYSVVYDQVTPRVLYAAGAINGANDTLRIFRSTDNGSNWTSWMKEYLPDCGAIINMISCNNTLFVLTTDHDRNARGVYKLSDSSVSIPELTTDQLRFFPNPATENLTINFVGNQNKAYIQIYNSMGELVKEVEIAQPIQIDISGFSNGLYVMCFKNQLQQQRFMFIKQ